MKLTWNGKEIVVRSASGQDRIISRKEIDKSIQKCIFTGAEIKHYDGSVATFHHWTGPKRLACIISKGTIKEDNNIEVITFGVLVSSNMELIVNNIPKDNN